MYPNELKNEQFGKRLPQPVLISFVFVLGGNLVDLGRLLGPVVSFHFTLPLDRSARSLVSVLSSMTFGSFPTPLGEGIPFVCPPIMFLECDYR